MPFVFAAYRARLHALPPPEALRSMFPYLSERMRKRRAFADKELEVVMFERERQIEAEKLRANGLMAQAAALDPARSRQLLGHHVPEGLPPEDLPHRQP